MSSAHQAAAGTGLGAAVPSGPTLIGTINITTGPDNLPPFFTAQGLFYSTNQPPLGAAASGALNSNNTGRIVSTLCVQTSGGVAQNVYVTMAHTSQMYQNAFTSLNVGGLGSVLAAAATGFTQTTLSGGYYEAAWIIPFTVAPLVTATAYDFIFT